MVHCPPRDLGREAWGVVGGPWTVVCRPMQGGAYRADPAQRQESGAVVVVVAVVAVVVAAAAAVPVGLSPPAG